MLRWLVLVLFKLLIVKVSFYDIDCDLMYIIRWMCINMYIGECVLICIK